jgi:protein required for attachment to host cells
LVLIADGEKALFVENLTDAANPNLHVWREGHRENPPDREQGSDRPGRFHDSAAGQKSTFAETDWHRLATGHFAQELADGLYRHAHRGDFDRLVIVAPPRVLGDLRGRLRREVADRVVAEIPKTLTNRPVSEIESLLAAERGGD